MRESFYDEYFRLEDRHWWFVGRRQIILAVLAAHLDPMPAGDRRILDMGCGTGASLRHLRRFGGVDGVDVDERAVGFCRARGEDRVQLLESDVLPFPDDSFDLLTALDVLEHIDDDRGALREIGRVLRPGGMLLATVPAYGWMWGPQDEISHHFRRYGTADLRRKIIESGLELQRISHFNSILFPAIALVRVVRRLGPTPGEVRSDFELTKEGRVNSMLARVLSSEAGWLRRRRNLPVGVSIMALATVPEA